MKRLVSLVPALLCLLPHASAAQEVERFALANGLIVLVQVDRRLPLVNVTCMYRIGSANEAPGITGIAHYVEHMNFRATENVSKADITGTIERIGGRWNGYTSVDQTLYAATVPAWALESVLRIEAERMARARFNPTEFERERTSVISELQGYENDPASLLWDLVLATSFELHPYRYNIIGWLTDVESITREQAYRFYKDFYGPNHAVLTLEGDVDPKQVRTLVEKYFGALPPAPRSTEVRVREPEQRGEKRVTLRTPGGQQHLLLVFRAPPATDPDFPVLLVLDAILAGGRGLVTLPGTEPALPNSRLQEAVERVGGLRAATGLTPTRAPFVYALGATASASAKLDQIEAALTAELDRMAQEGITAKELTAAKKRLEAARVFEAGRLSDRAHRLAYYQALGSWKRPQEIEHAMARVTSKDLQAYARKWLKPSGRTVGWHVIDETPGPVAVPADTTSRPSAAAEDVAPSAVPSRALQPLSPLTLEKGQRQLANGVRLRVAQRQAPSGVLQVRLGFGSIDDPSGREGLALLVARLLASHPALASLSALGAQLTATAIDSPITFSNREYFDLSVRFLSEDWQAVVKQVAQALRVGSFGAEAIERARAKLLDEMEGFQNDATWVAEAGAVARLMPGWHPPFGTRASIKRITPVDVNEFLARHTRGGEVWVGLVAPAEPARQLAALAEAFGPFSSGTARSTAKSDQEWFAGEERVPLEGKTQAEVVAALPGVARDHPDYLPLRLLNYILGETGYAGRLGKALVDPGLSYSVYAVPEFSRLPGPLLIRTATGTANLAATLDTIRSVLSDLRPLTAGEDEGEGRRGIEEWELREAQAYVLGRMVLGLESQEALARTLVEAEYFGQDLLDFPKRSGEVLSVTQQQLNEVARRTYRPERLSLAVAGAVPKAPQ